MKPTVSQGAGTRATRWVWAVVALASLCILVWVAVQRGWVLRLADHDQLVTWMREGGPAGPLICIGIQFLQVVIFAIPGEITQIAAGYVFGPWLGLAYSAVGILLGSAFGFGFARAVGRPAVQRILGLARLARIDRLLRSRKGMLAIFVLYLLPGTPKDAMAYGAGLTAMPFLFFLPVSVSARLPALLLSTLFGAEFREWDLEAMVWIVACAGVLIAVSAYIHFRSRR